MALLPQTLRGMFSNQFLPHAYCYLYDKGLIALHVGSDTAIWLSYVSISVTLTYLVYRTRREIPFSWMFLAFGTFIIACGFTHLMEVIVLWKPVYWLAGDVKLVTAVASVITAIALPPLVPKVHNMISTGKIAEQYRKDLETANLELSHSNEALKKEVGQRALVEQRLRALSGRLLQIQDEERRRVAREVHDSAGQMVAALSINLGILAAHEHPLEEQTRLLSDSRTILDSLNKELRTISHLLHPPLLDEVGLASALQWYVDGFAERSGISTALEMDLSLGRLHPDLEITIFRVIQESLTNVHRHSGSPKAQIRLVRCGSAIDLEVRDEGKGMPLEKQLHGSEQGAFGVGIAGMRERVMQLGGKLEIESHGSGTTVSVHLPVNIPGAAENTEDADGVAVSVIGDSSA
jgi:signal transduction histidine kinase